MTDTKAIPAPPPLIRSLVAGFDIITKHISLILFPIGLDLLIWLSPRLRLKGLIEKWVGAVLSQSLTLAPDLETTQMLESAQELWALLAEQFNLWVALRSYPVGIPSLMSSILPSVAPAWVPINIEIGSFGELVGLSILLTVVGLVLGTLFYQFVASAVLSDQIQWRRIFMEWPWSSLQVILLALVWFGLLLGISIPAGCVISFAALGSAMVGQCATLLYGGIMIWIIFPLLFSAHGIFINHQKVWPSIKQGIHITRLTLPATGLFFLAVLLLSQGSSLLWRIPPDDSWLMLLSLAGHAFVTTGLLSASFVYYRGADQWIRSLQQQDFNQDHLRIA